MIHSIFWKIFIFRIFIFVFIPIIKCEPLTECAFTYWTLSSLFTILSFHLIDLDRDVLELIDASGNIWRFPAVFNRLELVCSSLVRLNRLDNLHQSEGPINGVLEHRTSILNVLATNLDPASSPKHWFI